MPKCPPAEWQSCRALYHLLTSAQWRSIYVVNIGVRISLVKPSNCFRRLEQLVLSSISDTSLSSLMMWSWQSYPPTVLNERMRHFRGVKTYSDCSYIFSGGWRPRPATPTIYAPAQCAAQVRRFDCHIPVVLTNYCTTWCAGGRTERSACRSVAVRRVETWSLLESRISVASETTFWATIKTQATSSVTHACTGALTSFIAV